MPCVGVVIQEPSCASLRQNDVVRPAPYLFSRDRLVVALGEVIFEFLHPQSNCMSSRALWRRNVTPFREANDSISVWERRLQSGKQRGRRET
jgi:hypothetical protein